MTNNALTRYCYEHEVGMTKVFDGDYYLVKEADLLISNLRAELEAERAKVGTMRERCAVLAWITGIDMYETRFDHDPRDVGSAIAGAIRALPTEEGERA
jgi:hypothetical protein